MSAPVVIPERFDEHRPCPKCWWSPVSVRHCARHFSIGLYISYHETFPVDHLHRECGRCGFTWIELPWDAPEHTTDEWNVLVMAVHAERQSAIDEDAALRRR